MKAMVLAAGLGTRMAPLSRARAKPVLPVLGEPLLLRMIRVLAEQGIDHVVVNAHAHPEQVRSILEDAPVRVDVSLEPELRGSGGGLAWARPLLDTREPFLAVNADMCAELDLPALLAAHRRQGALATLVLRDEERKRNFGSIGYAESGLVSRITDQVDRGSENGSGLFAGVHVIEPELFDRMPQRETFHILSDVYVPLVAAGEPLGTWLQPSEIPWWPVGTPHELLDTNLAMLCDAVGDRPDAVICSSDAKIAGTVLGPAWIGAGAAVAPDAVAGPGIVMGAGASLGPGSTAHECLLLPEAAPPEGCELARAIAYDSEVWVDA